MDDDALSACCQELLASGEDDTPFCKLLDGNGMREKDGEKLKSSLRNTTNLISNFANLQLSDFSQALPVKIGKLSDATFFKSILL
ncbi:hypothetical protein ES332_A01G103900v1 [Gossypium tomentosum]|uniref:Uncharacterized protein n=1 Tax=Gossypium tomentosum TaxID=34277 RepID=A0A5D2RPX0_GOSTO|nr:hypothetical protein ES332_A01G103900v1 [Gossypium tomentosum]